jgi:RNA polymerase sigma-70 factor, ECF subfamily
MSPQPPSTTSRRAVSLDRPLGCRLVPWESMEPLGRAARSYHVDTDVVEQETTLRPSDFSAFYRQSWVEIYRPLVATLRDPDLAAEAVDEAMERAYARWSKVSSLSNPEGWIYRVAYRWGVDRLRRRSVERRLLPRLSTGPTMGEIPTVEPLLGGALSALPIDQRAVVVLACAFDWSEADIADALRIRPGTVKSRLHRGLARLREELGA